MEILNKILLVMLVIGLLMILLGVVLYVIQHFNKSEQKPQGELRDWRLYAYGGGAPINIQAIKQSAIDYCAKHHGTVMFVDEDKAFIFFKPFTKT